MKIKEAIVFGAGEIGKTVLYILKLEKINIISCFDNDQKKIGQIFWNDIVCSMPKFIDSNIPVLISVLDTRVRQEIREQCKELGYVNIFDIEEDKIRHYVENLPDKEFIKLQYCLRMQGRILDLDNPQSFNEKLQWLKLYNHDPQYTTMTDKYEVKKYVANLIGEQYIIPTLGVWDSFDEIDFGRLPKQFVLKCTHDSGSGVIVLDKNNFNYQSMKEKFERKLQTNYYEAQREWVYKNVRPRIIAEQYMIDESQKKRGSLFDYKVHCFNGVPTYIQVIGNRNYHTHSGMQMIFDFDWNEQSWSFGDYPKYEVKLPKPTVLMELYRLCEVLCKQHRYIRLDFYIVENKIFFGEITFIPASGYYIYNDDWKRETDLMLGNKIV